MILCLVYQENANSIFLITFILSYLTKGVKLPTPVTKIKLLTYIFLFSYFFFLLYRKVMCYNIGVTNILMAFF